MLPAIMGAYKGLSLGWRIGIPALIVLVLLGSYPATYYYGKHNGNKEGKKEVRAEWDASLVEQMARSNEALAAHTASTQQVMGQKIKLEQQVRERVKYVEREKIRYVQTATPCKLDPAAVSVFDAISGLSAPVRAEHSPADGSSGGIAESSETGITTFEAVQAYYTAVEQLTFLWIDYAALVQWERGRYIVEETASKQWQSSEASWPSIFKLLQFHR